MPFNFPRFLFELFRFYDASFSCLFASLFSCRARLLAVAVVSNHSSIGSVPHLFVHPNRVLVARSNEQVDEVRVVEVFRDSLQFFHQFVGDFLPSKTGDGHCGHVPVEETPPPRISRYTRSIRRQPSRSRRNTPASARDRRGKKITVGFGQRIGVYEVVFEKVARRERTEGSHREKQTVFCDAFGSKIDTF